MVTVTYLFPSGKSVLRIETRLHNGSGRLLVFTNINKDSSDCHDGKPLRALKVLCNVQSAHLGGVWGGGGVVVYVNGTERQRPHCRIQRVVSSLLCLWKRCGPQTGWVRPGLRNWCARRPLRQSPWEMPDRRSLRPVPPPRVPGKACAAERYFGSSARPSPPQAAPRLGKNGRCLSCHQTYTA